MTLSRATLAVCAAVGLMGSVVDIARAGPITPGFGLETYAALPGAPQRISFDGSSGTLYVGEANNNPQFPVLKVLPPNGSVEHFGNATLFDPDVVLYDATGAIAPVPGSVLVGGQPGYISAIEPDGTVVPIFSDGSGFSNPNAMGFDSIGCLLFLDTPGGRIFRTCSSAELPTLVFQPPMDATHMAINSLDWVYVATRHGGLAGPTSIYVYCNGGSHLLVDGLDPAGAGGRANHLPIALDPGEVGGADVLYAISGSDLRSFEFDSATCPPQLISTDIIGAGFDGDFYNDMAFGPDGALYISHQNDGGVIADGIIRVFNDCNTNGMNDQCDIDCGSTNGLCDLPTCSTAADGNTNGIPDECENQPPVIACNGPVVLWSPDHELVDVSAGFDVVDPDGDPVTQTYRVFSGEPELPETGDGTGRHAPDFKDEHDGGRGLLVRSERRGAEDGRYYIFVITADDGNGGVTTEVCIAAVVPHGQDQQSLDTVLAQAEGAAVVVQNAADNGGALPPTGFFEHGLSEPLGPKQ